MGWEANGVIPSVGKTSVEGQRARIFIISTNFIKEPFFLAQYCIDCLSRTSLSLRFKRNVKHRWKAEVFLLNFYNYGADLVFWCQKHYSHVCSALVFETTTFQSVNRCESSCTIHISLFLLYTYVYVTLIVQLLFVLR